MIHTAFRLAMQVHAHGTKTDWRWFGAKCEASPERHIIMQSRGISGYVALKIRTVSRTRKVPPMQITPQAKSAQRYRTDSMTEMSSTALSSSSWCSAFLSPFSISTGPTSSLGTQNSWIMPMIETAARPNQAAEEPPSE